MDQHHPPAWTHLVTTRPSRRDILRGLAGAGLGLGKVRWPSPVEAKKKLKRKKKCAKAGQTSKKKKRCCRGLVKDATGRCAQPCTPTSCTATSLCVDRVCQPCDVCQPAGACRHDTVQAAVDDANNGATLSLCAGTFTETIAIIKNLTLIGMGDGDGPGNTILDGADAGRVVVIGEGSTATLQNLRITGGNVTDDGGGIVNFGALALTGCTVSGNTANIGGGIDNLGTLTLTDCAVSGNTADYGGGGVVNFGGTVELIDSRVTANAAGSTIGGIWNEGTVICSSDSTVSNNTAGNPPVPSDCIDANGGTGCATCTD
jgi:hypothetical protein